MPFCTNCGAPLKDNTNFCVQCGAPVKKQEKKLQDTTIFIYVDDEDSVYDELFIETKDIGINELTSKDINFLVPYHFDKFYSEPVEIKEEHNRLAVYIHDCFCGFVLKKDIDTVKQLLASDQLDKIIATISTGIKAQAYNGDEPGEYSIEITNEDMRISLHFYLKK